MTKKLKGLFVVLMAFMLVACGGKDSGTSKENADGNTGTDKPAESGGEVKDVMRVALTGQPPTIEPAMTAGSSTKQVAKHLYETLYTLNSNYQPVPMLAESYEMSEDGKKYTFKLREGVKFHNGKEMKSEDVVASMNRWIELSPSAKETFGEAQFESDGDYVVFVELAKTNSETLDVMASPKQFPGITTKEAVEAAGPDGVKEYIGTGPFKFDEWKQDQYIKYSKFEEYQPLDTPADGLSGKKEALVNELYFDIVTDASTRLAGIQTGEYDVSYSVPQDSYEQVKADPSIKTYMNLYGNLTLLYNKEGDTFADVNMRKAVNALIDSEEIMLGALTHPDLYELDNGYMHTTQKNWYTDAGKEEYNQANIDAAKEYLEKAGYNGEEIVIIGTRDYDYQYNAAVVLKEQLSKAGINARLDIYDWATLLEKERDPSNWDLLVIGVSTVTTPSQVLYLTYNQHGFTKDEKIASMLDEIRASTSIEDSQKLFSELQEYGWKEYVPVTNIGFHYDFITSSDKVEGLTIFDGPLLWNTKVLK